VKLNFLAICCVGSGMNRLRLLTSLGLILSLALASCTNTQTINDQLPTAGTQNNPPLNNPPGNNPPATDPVTVSSGTFVSVHHTTTGMAKLIKLTDGRFIARLEGFKTDSGPDVRVWVSETSTITDDALQANPYTDLEGLKSTNGNQNYAIPSSVDVGKIKSIVIWCRAAKVAFGGAVLK
jgi:Electron transfer DM13